MSKNNQAVRGSTAANTSNEVVYLFRSHHIGDLEGQVLTFIDASIQDQIQRKALKDLMRPMLWRWAIDSNIASMYGLDSNTLERMPIVALK